MIEIEVKAKIDDERYIEEKIKEMGGLLIGEEKQRDIYFNHPCRDFRKSDEALRVRIKDFQAEITYKGKKLDKITKTREEITVKVKDFKGIIEMLKKLNFKVVAEVVKHRKKYMLNNLIICIDNVENLGKFIEVEEKSDKYDPTNVLTLMKKLGIKKTIRKSYLEMLLEGER